MDYRYAQDTNNRNVFIFVLDESEIDLEDGQLKENTLRPRSRIIPSNVKKEVWERDKGKCVICGSSDNLHFDHIIPFSKGGSSLVSKNIQLLCVRHNISKRDRIE